MTSQHDGAAAGPQDRQATVKQLQNMPLAMRQLKQWHFWRHEQVEGRHGLQKVPYYAKGRRRHGTPGGAQDREDLASFDDVLRLFADGARFDGIAFAFLGDDGLIGIDLDWKKEPAGAAQAHVAQIVQACNSYTESSPSGKGLHIIVAGSVDSFKNDAIGVEVYCGGRYFTCTGARLAGTPAEVQAVPADALVYLHGLVERAKERARKAKHDALPPAASTPGTPPSPAPANAGIAPGQGGADFKRVNAAALAMLSAWVPEVLPAARVWRDGFRVGSKDLGRDLEEDLQILPQGICDFGEERGLSPIDLIMQRVPGQATAKDALHWLAPRVGVVLPKRPLRLVKPKPAPEPEPEAPPLAEERGGGAADDDAEGPALAADATHDALARAWLRSRTMHGFAPVYTEGSFSAGDADGLWRRLSNERVQVDIGRMFPGCKLCKKTSDYKQIRDQAAALCEQERFFDDAEPGVVTPAGFHTLDANGSVQTIELKLAHRQAFKLEHRPEFDSEAVLLDGVLRSAFEGDDADAQIDLWWQAVGAIMFGLMPRLQIVLLLLGRERSGKSLLQRLLERMFPVETVCAVSPESWGHEYHVAALAGKRLNVVGELSDESPIPAAAFKNVTGQNLVGARNPTHRPFSFRPNAGHVFAANVMPPTKDRSEAFYRRWRVLRFANTVPAERVDPHLLEKITTSEMPAILASAFMGAERVMRAGTVRTSAAHDAVLKRWRLAANPLEQFLADEQWIELDPSNRQHRTAEVYEAYRRWSAAAGFRNPFGRNHFLDLLESTGATRGVMVKRLADRIVVVGVRLLRTE